MDMYWPGTTAAATGSAGFEAKHAPASTPGADPLGSALSPQAVPAREAPARLARAQVAPARVVQAQVASARMVPAQVAPAQVVPVPATGPETGNTTPLAGRNARHLPCSDDPELFFAESPEDVESAKAMCRGCPARLACFAGAVERREPWGVWGGELFMRGTVVPRKRPRGRPRKSEVAA
jgi:WhiB family redox-sensing transcriptional regulator